MMLTSWLTKGSPYCPTSQSAYVADLDIVIHVGRQVERQVGGAGWWKSSPQTSAQEHPRIRAPRSIRTRGNFKTSAHPGKSSRPHRYIGRIPICGFPEIRNSENPEYGISGNPDFQISRNPDSRKSGFPEIRISGCPELLSRQATELMTAGLPSCL